MAGSKRNKLKKALLPASSPPADTISAEDDSELMDDLMAQLDSRNQTVQAESAAVLQAVAQEANSKQDAKSRFQARQVTISAVLLKSFQ